VNGIERRNAIAAHIVTARKFCYFLHKKRNFANSEFFLSGLSEFPVLLLADFLRQSVFADGTGEVRAQGHIYSRARRDQRWQGIAD
jgi:hypothetical protein